MNELEERLRRLNFTSASYARNWELSRKSLDVISKTDLPADVKYWISDMLNSHIRFVENRMELIDKKIIELQQKYHLEDV